MLNARLARSRALDSGNVQVRRTACTQQHDESFISHLLRSAESFGELCGWYNPRFVTVTASTNSKLLLLCIFLSVFTVVSVSF